MNTRELTVYRGRGNSYQLPQILLQGQWLQNLGFSIGDKVAVTCQQDRIIIIKSADGQASTAANENRRKE